MDLFAEPYSLHPIPNPFPSALFPTPYSLHSTYPSYSPHPISYILHTYPIPYTLFPTLNTCSRSPIPYTHPIPYTVHHTPYSLHTLHLFAELVDDIRGDPRHVFGARVGLLL